MITDDELADMAFAREVIGKGQAPDDMPGPDRLRSVDAKGDPHGGLSVP